MKAASVILSALVAASPAVPAFAQSRPVFVEGIAAVLEPAVFSILGALVATVLVLLAVAVWLLHRLSRVEAHGRREADERLRLDQMLAVAPDGFFRWDRQSDGALISAQCSRRLAVLLGLFGGTGSGWIEVRDCFGQAEAAILEVAVEALHRNGIGFELELGLRDSLRRLVVVGNRAADAEGRPLADLVWMRDITESTAALDRLATEVSGLERDRDRLRGLAEGLPVPVWLRDGDLALVICNQAYARAVDAASPGVALAAGTELVPGQQGREARTLAARARASGEPRSDRFHLVIGGARRLVEIIETPFTSQSGTLLTVGVAFDRTVEEDLRGQLERHIAAHAEVLETLGSAIAIFGADTRLAFFNSAFTRLWHLESDWLAGKPSLGNVLDQLRERRRLPEVADFRAYKDEELRLFTQLLEPREDLLHLPDERALRRFVVPHPFGGLLFVYEDVTDALALERSLATSLAVHRATLENLHEGVAVFSGDGRLRLSNPAYGRVWGLTPDDLAGEPHFAELIGRHREFFVESDEWGKLRATLLSLFSERVPHSGRLTRADGIIIDYASVPLPDGALLTTWLDVGDRVRAEHALRERNEAVAAADRLKSEFISNINAELRAPLATILRSVEALSALRPEMNGDAERLDDLTEASRHLQQAIGDFLDLASIEAGQLSLAVETVDVDGLLESVLSLARERLQDHPVTLDYECQPGIGRIAGDGRRLRQALYTLLANTIRATPERGRVGVKVRREGGHLLITVSTAGDGMVAEDRERLFGRAGAGLGLSLVRRFVALHGGTMEDDSAEGAGGSITLRLPVGMA